MKDDEKELCGWCGEDLDQDGVCDCPGAREARQGEVPADF